MELGGILAEPNNIAELRAAQFYRATFDWYTWVGASDAHEEGTWEWASDGRAVADELWAPSEPNNAGEGEHCTEVHSHGLNDVPCHWERPFACEFAVGDGEGICF